MKTIALNNKLLILMVMVVFSCGKVAAQEVTTDVIKVEVTIADADSQMELVSWLMATKQGQSADQVEVTATKKSAKKQFINSGVQTNRLLNKTFLKKAQNRDGILA